MERSIVNFISCQPYEPYFKWQLELQCYNFLSLGIPLENIFSLSPKTAESESLFNKFQLTHSRVFFLNDSRQNKSYPSSLRPNLIKKHLLANPKIYANPIFYHDSDIIFRQLPDFDSLLQDDIWYVSDTRSYMDSHFIKKFGGDELLLKMSEVVGLSPQMIEENDDCVGGAQYLMKNVSYEFWDKVERDSEKLFNVLEEFNNEMSESFYLETGRQKSDYIGIQAWCADMWSVLWNAWLFGFKTQISTELDFCWADDPIELWQKKKTLHYTGIEKRNNENNFDKKNYYLHTPFYANLNFVNKRNCGNVIAEFIKKYEKDVLTLKKVNLSNVTFLIPFQKRDKREIQNIEILSRYIYKHFNTKLVVINDQEDQNLEQKISSSNSFISILNTFDQSPLMEENCKKIMNSISTDFVILIDHNTIISVEQIVNHFNTMEKSFKNAIVFNFTNCLKIDNIFKNIFGMVLDDSLLNLNKEKFNKVESSSRAIFLNISMFKNLVNTGEFDFFNILIENVLKKISRRDFEQILIRDTVFYLN